MKMMLLLATLALLTSFSVKPDPDAIVGIWQNGSGKGHVQIYKNGEKYFGKIVWLRENRDAGGKPKLDQKNTDPSKRKRPLIGLVMLRDFEYDDGRWTNGRIYNPSDGKEYKAQIRKESNTKLQVRGYVGMTLFGKTDTWTKVR